MFLLNTTFIGTFGTWGDCFTFLWNIPWLVKILKMLPKSNALYKGVILKAPLWVSRLLWFSDSVKKEGGGWFQGLLYDCHVLESRAEILDGDSVLDRAHSLQTKAQEVWRITERVRTEGTADHSMTFISLKYMASWPFYSPKQRALAPMPHFGDLAKKVSAGWREPIKGHIYCIEVCRCNFLQIVTGLMQRDPKADAQMQISTCLCGGLSCSV